MKKQFIPLIIILICTLLSCHEDKITLASSPNDLVFTELATTWDEGIPLGNGIIGALVWQKDSSLRMALDHVGLWDLRQRINLDTMRTHNYKWVRDQVVKKDILPIRQIYEDPYRVKRIPTKIPGGALEFNIAGFGKVDTVRLLLNNALCEVKWANGTRLQTFVHATENKGRFRFENVDDDFRPVLVTPNYGSMSANVENAQSGPDLTQLEYVQGELSHQGNTIVYHQPGSEGFYYEIAVSYSRKGKNMEGVWSIMPKPETGTNPVNITRFTEEALQQGFVQSYNTHNMWWKDYWAKSSVNVPDAVLSKQYYNEMYKFGSTARSYSPPVSLQAVWTADNGKLPPWRGDYHHNLNTQLSYWPCYTGNRLEEGLGFLNWLWKTMPVNKQYTVDFFGADGLAVPGMTTINGDFLGGWSQYALNATVSAWLSQHFYLHWKYSQDKEFLKNRAYPYIKEAAVFLDHISEKDADGKRKLPISSSPEIYDNSLKAWFLTTTNFDLGLIRFVYTAASELAGELGLSDDAAKWKTILDEWPDIDLDEQGAMTIAQGFPYNESHRHFSHLMAIHPLGLIDWNNGERDRRIIKASIKKLDEYGPDYWCGYSYSWLGNVKARAMDGEGAAEALKIFAEHFCLRNTFHANGDQTKMGYSRYTYRPFTLEGNMAFASGIHEMLIQSHTGIIHLFPAIPTSWKDVSFEKLRAVGAFLVSAQMENKKLAQITIESEKGGILRLTKPTDGNYREAGGKILNETNGIWTIEMQPGETVTIVSDLK